jgi:calcineurin-like phosphoesterase family protein
VSATLVVADLHLGHQRICTFVDEAGRKTRPFTTAEEMDEAIIASWNKVVRPQDKVYILGDVAIRKWAIPTLERLNGKLRLVRGNHDIFDIERDYLPYFGEVYGCRVLSGCILTHIPIHPGSLGRFGLNIHGHLHQNKVRMPDGSIDPRYLCVSVEQTNYHPITLEEAFSRARANGYIERRKDEQPG